MKTEKISGLRVIYKNNFGEVLCSYYDGSPVLAGMEQKNGSTIKDTANKFMSELTVELFTLKEVFQGVNHDSEYYHVIYFDLETEETPVHEGTSYGLVKPFEILKGKHGLQYLDVFQAMRWLKRRPISYSFINSVSKMAHERGSANCIEAINMIIDEMQFFIDIEKAEPLEEIFRNLEVEKLHADIVDAALAMTCSIPGHVCPSNLAEFIHRCKTRIEEVDAIINRKKYKLVGLDGRVISEDVRGDARTYYAKKSAEYSKMLKEGTLHTILPERLKNSALGKAIKERQNRDLNNVYFK